MKSIDIETRAIRIYGKRHWIARFAEDIGKDRSSVYRWWKDDRVPKYVGVFLDTKDEQRRMAKIARQLVGGK